MISTARNTQNAADHAHTLDSGACRPRLCIAHSPVEAPFHRCDATACRSSRLSLAAAAQPWANRRHGLAARPSARELSCPGLFQRGGLLVPTQPTARRTRNLAITNSLSAVHFSPGEPQPRGTVPPPERVLACLVDLPDSDMCVYAGHGVCPPSFIETHPDQWQTWRLHESVQHGTLLSPSTSTETNRLHSEMYLRF